MDAKPLLDVREVRHEYFRGRLNKRRRTFLLEADFRIAEPSIVGVMGANGSGKTTLFEIIAGTTPPTAGSVHCFGEDIGRIKYAQRDRIAIHYHQSYQVRKPRRGRPGILLRPARSDYPIIHLFDEPQFNTQDGYIGYMLNFFRDLRQDGNLVLMSLHPTEQYHLEILQEVCEQFLFISKGALSRYGSWDSFVSNPDIRSYLGQNLRDYQSARSKIGRRDQ